MAKRTTIEIDEVLLERAMAALGSRTMRETVETALRFVAESGESRRARAAEEQIRYFAGLQKLADIDVLRSDEMWH